MRQLHPTVPNTVGLLPFAVESVGEQAFAVLGGQALSQFTPEKLGRLGEVADPIAKFFHNFIVHGCAGHHVRKQILGYHVCRET